MASCLEDVACLCSLTLRCASKAAACLPDPWLSHDVPGSPPTDRTLHPHHSSDFQRRLMLIHHQAMLVPIGVILAVVASVASADWAWGSPNTGYV